MASPKGRPKGRPEGASPGVAPAVTDSYFGSFPKNLIWETYLGIRREFSGNFEPRLRLREPSCAHSHSGAGAGKSFGASRRPLAVRQRSFYHHPPGLARFSPQHRGVIPISNRRLLIGTAGALAQFAAFFFRSRTFGPTGRISIEPPFASTFSLAAREIPCTLSFNRLVSSPTERIFR